MAFIIIPSVPGTYPTGAHSLPDMVSFCVTDNSGAGGDIYLNAGGILTGVVTGAIDLRTFFVTTLGVNFNSIPLVQAFKPVTTNAQLMKQFVERLEINYFAVTTPSSAPFGLRFGPLYGLSSGPSDTFYVHINATAGGEGYEGDTWRVNIKLRHSITN